MSDSTDWLQRLFLSLCDGEWEHYHGCEIETMSDPGWQLKFDFRGTSFAEKLLAPMEGKESSLVWLKCRMDGGIFEAQCGPKQLDECIEILRDVVEGRRT